MTLAMRAANEVMRGRDREELQELGDADGKRELAFQPHFIQRHLFEPFIRDALMFLT